MWRENILCLNMSKDLAYKKTVSFINAVYLKMLDSTYTKLDKTEGIKFVRYKL
jgi:hypothetical protein